MAYKANLVATSDYYLLSQSYVPSEKVANMKLSFETLIYDSIGNKILI